VFYFKRLIAKPRCATIAMPLHGENPLPMNPAAGCTIHHSLLGRDNGQANIFF